MIVLVCSDNIASIFSAVYEAWAGKYNRDALELKIDGAYEYEFFKEYIKVKTDESRAQKVVNTIKKQFGKEFLSIISLVLWSYEEDKADAVYKTIKYGIETKKYGNFLSDFRIECIQRINKLYRNIYNEIHHYYGFVRFSELDKERLFAQIRPKNYCLEALSEHFADRLPSENWIIYDVGRNIAAVHKMRAQWFIVRDVIVDNELINNKLSDREDEYRKLWRLFFDTISIEDRKNKKLQRNNFPLRFREFIIEDTK